MQLFCPACHAAFPGTQRCPQCGGLLLMPQEAAEAVAQSKAPLPPIPQPTQLGRVTVGSVFALGMYLGLRKLATGVVLVSHSDPEGWWGSFDGLCVICGAQVIAVIFGALIAAAGRVGGFGFGAAVGGVCGGLFLGGELLAGASPQDLVLYMQPVVLTLIGGVAGVLATRIWGAVPEIDMPIPQPSTMSSSRFVLGEFRPPERPTAWARILVGALIMVSAVMAAEQVRSKAQKYSGGMLHVKSVGQGQFLNWQLAVLGGLLGGVAASAGTGAGIRHGLIAGGLAGVGVLGVTAARGEPLSPIAYWLSKLSLGEAPPTDPAAIAAAMGGMVLLGIMGGWLGGVLVQPMAPPHMRQRLKGWLE
ncbi:MAG: hypothetical protein L0241_31985 [Planctomycetia bacterium]|nr:hypothetical protein [Planctomycetia bacterium]